MDSRFKVERINLNELDDASRISLSNLIISVENEACHPPGDPSQPEEQDVFRRFATVGHGRDQHSWVVWSGPAQAVGVAWLTLRDAAQFNRVGKFDIKVAAAQRRRGIGSALLEQILKHSTRMGLGTVYGWAAEFSAGAGFLRARLERIRTRESWSALALGNVDLPALHTRASDDRFPELEPVVWARACPSDLLEAYARCHQLTGASVRGSEAGSELATAKLIAELEARAIAVGESWITVAARVRGGGLVGFSQITVPAAGTGRAEQAFTGVVPAWRGKGVAGWLKAKILTELLVREPSATHLTTENNGENPAILAANTTLGFETYLSLCAWETEVKGASLAVPES